MFVVKDFINNHIVNNVKSEIRNKKIKIKSKKIDNILVNFDQILDQDSVKEELFLITQIDKIFNLEDINLSKESFRINKIKSIIKKLSNVVSILSNKYKKVTFFLWPQDIKDDYFGNLNFKKFGKSWLINFINLEVASNLSNLDNVYLIDPNNKLLKYKKKIDIHDYKTKYLVDNFYSLDFLEFLSSEICEVTKISEIKKTKLIILDLDNTLWGGEAGERNYNLLELGPNSIKGVVFQEFQKRLKILKSIGFVLAICSKNDLSNVQRVFKFNKNMILKLSDFSAYRINWKNKNENIREILTELNLREENSIFIDDTRYERNIVGSDLKDIKIFDFPSNVLMLNEKFNQLKDLNKNQISETDKKRTKLYLEEKKRIRLKKKFFDKTDWLSGLKIKLKIRELKDYKRAEEMFVRTNQFNISHNPISAQEIKNLIKKKTLFFETEMSDKFGDYGIIAIFSLKFEKNNFFITNFLQSCRVFERNVEDFIFRYILQSKITKKKNGFVYINRNKKNTYVQNLFDQSDYLKKINHKTFKINKEYTFEKIKKIKIDLNK
jgi:FkbH-like protein